MEITFLGTGSMIPTPERNHQSLLIDYNGKGILVDCGEGTQKQIRIARLKPSKIEIILLSHWHGDHVIGLVGLLFTLSNSEYKKKMKIFGPVGTKNQFEHMKKAFLMNLKFPVEVFEIKEGLFYEEKDFYIEAIPLEHGVPSLGYRFVEKDKIKILADKLKKNYDLKNNPIIKLLQEGKDIEWKGKKIRNEEVTKVTKGKIIGLVCETRICKNAVIVAKDSDLLISESTHIEKDKDERYMHLTPGEAATIAKKADAKRLILTHFSQRYKDMRQMLKEAKDVFKNVECAKDFMKIKL